MTLSGIIEALGLGAAKDARELVARLSGERLRVVVLEEPLARALERAGHQAIAPEAGAADAALVLALPEGDDALAQLGRLTAATRAGGTLTVASASPRPADRARVAGLLLRVGLTRLEQRDDGPMVYTTGTIRPRLDV